MNALLLLAASLAVAAPSVETVGPLKVTVPDGCGVYRGKDKLFLSISKGGHELLLITASDNDEVGKGWAFRKSGSATVAGWNGKEATQVWKDGPVKDGRSREIVIDTGKSPRFIRLHYSSMTPDEARQSDAIIDAIKRAE